MRRYLAGIVLPLIPSAVYFLCQVPFERLLFYFVEFPLKIYGPYNRVPYPRLTVSAEQFLTGQTFYFYFTPLTLMSSILFLVAGWHKPRDAKRSLLFWPMLFFTLVGMLQLSQARFRADATHLFPAFLAASGLMAFLLTCVHERRGWKYLVPPVLVVTVFLSPVLLSKELSLLFPTAPTPLEVPRARNIDVAPKDDHEAQEFRDYEQAVNYVRQITVEGERIFLGSVRHDRMCSADPMFYFLSERPSATRYHEMSRGVVVREDIQKEIIGELEKNHVRVVIQRRFLDDQCGEPNESSRASGSKLLDEYLRTHFTLDRHFGGNTILKNKTE